MIALHRSVLVPFARIGSLDVSMVIACLFLLARAPAQQTWVVDWFLRPGAHFQDLPAAVAAASSGDTIQLRGTTTSPDDGYLAPTIQGKALKIVGDHQAIRPIVTGSWVIHGVPANESLVLQQLVLAGRDTYLNPQTRYFQMDCTNNQGAIVLDDLNVQLSIALTSVYHGLSGTHFTDCSLVVLRNSTIDTSGGPWESIRSTLVIDSCVIRNTANPSNGWAAGAIFADNSRLHVVNSNLIGSYAPTQLLWYAGSSPIQTCASEIVISGNSRLEGGVDWNGVRYGAFFHRCFTVMGQNPNSGPSNCHVDPSTTVVGFYASDTQLVTDFGPQTGLSFTLSPAALQVTHYTVPSSLAALAIGPVTTTPWTHLVGPVFVDPIGMTDYLDIAPASGPLQRTFPLPPGLPLGTHACLQAFELLPSGTLLTSNATIAGLW